MPELVISALSTIYVKVPIAATLAGVVIDPTSDTVKLAFVRSGSPGVADWRTGTWETDTTTNPDTYLARCLVGPSGTGALTAGLYAVWVQVTDNPETVVLPPARYPLRVI